MEVRVWKHPAPDQLWVKPRTRHDESWKRYFWLGWVFMFKRKKKPKNLTMHMCNGNDITAMYIDEYNTDICAAADLETAKRLVDYKEGKDGST
jgi:hypothetical protein